MKRAPVTDPRVAVLFKRADDASGLTSVKAPDCTVCIEMAKGVHKSICVDDTCRGKDRDLLASVLHSVHSDHLTTFDEASKRIKGLEIELATRDKLADRRVKHLEDDVRQLEELLAELAGKTPEEMAKERKRLSEHTTSRFKAKMLRDFRLMDQDTGEGPPVVAGGSNSLQAIIRLFKTGREKENVRRIFLGKTAECHVCGQFTQARCGHFGCAHPLCHSCKCPNIKDGLLHHD